jgi:hypothetical protein
VAVDRGCSIDNIPILRCSCVACYSQQRQFQGPDWTEASKHVKDLFNVQYRKSVGANNVHFSPQAPEKVSAVIIFKSVISTENHNKISNPAATLD